MNTEKPDKGQPKQPPPRKPTETGKPAPSPQPQDDPQPPGVPEGPGKKP